MKEIEVWIDGEKQKASIRLLKPQEGEEYNLEELVRALRDAKIKMGIKQEILERILKEKLYGAYIPVAQGQPSQEGKEGYYTYYFDTEAENGKPRVQEDGTVLYSQQIEMTEKGSLLAVYTPAVQGVFGYDVHGKLLKPKRVKELPPLSGNNLERRENEYYAAAGGKIFFQRGTIIIKQVLEINGNLTHLIGDIDFLEDVLIRGDVEAGMTVKAQGSITIAGTSKDAVLYGGNTITVDRGIIGGEVYTQGDLKTKYLQHTKIFAEGDVIAGTIINAKVLSHGMVKALYEKGKVYGGSVIALRGMELINGGKESFVKTKLSVGMTPAILEEMHQLELDIVSLKHENGRLEKILNDIKTDRPGQKRYLEKQQTNSLAEKEEKERILLEKEERYGVLKGLIEGAGEARIMIKGKIYPDVEIQIYKSRFLNTSVQSGVAFYREGREIIKGLIKD